MSRTEPFTVMLGYGTDKAQAVRVNVPAGKPGFDTGLDTTTADPNGGPTGSREAGGE